MYKFSFFFLFCIGGVQAQTLAVNNVKASQSGGVANVTYDLQAPAGKTHYVSLYFSNDGGSSYSDELVYVNGDVKSNVTAGIGKKISWNSNKELGSLTGNIVFKVVAESKVKMPPPAQDEWLKMEVVDLERSSGMASVTLLVTPKRDCILSFSTNSSYLIDEKGNKFFGQWSDYQQKQLVLGTTAKLSISFQGVEESKNIALLNIFTGADHQFRGIVFSN